MPYLSRADIEAIYGAENLLRLIPDGVEPGPVIEQAILQACGEADLSLGMQRAVPLERVPEGIKAAILDLAFYRLAITHDRLTDEMRERARAARRLFENIAAGRISLGEAEPGLASLPASADSAASADGAFFEARPRLFRRGR